jgi:hypothetical protein
MAFPFRCDSPEEYDYARLSPASPLVEWCIASADCMKFSSRLRSRFMIHPAAGFLGGMIALACGTTAMAQSFDMQVLELDFTKPDVARQASWTQSTFLKLGPNGLIHDAPGPSIDQDKAAAILQRHGVSRCVELRREQWRAVLDEVEAEIAKARIECRRA